MMVNDYLDFSQLLFGVILVILEEIRKREVYCFPLICQCYK